MVAEADDVVVGAGGGDFADAFEVGCAGDVEDLGVFGEVGGGLCGEFVEAARALATAGDEDGGFGGVEAEAFGGGFAGGEVEDFRACGGAGELGLAAGEEGFGGIEAEEDFGAEAGGHHVGAAGSGVGVVDEGFEAEFVGGVDGRERGEAAHAEDGVGVEGLDDGFAAADGAPEPPEEWEHFGGEGRGFGDGGDGLEFQVGVFCGGFGIDFFLGDEEEDFVALGAEGFGDGDAGEEVAAGAATGDDDFERGGHGIGEGVGN